MSKAQRQAKPNKPNGGKAPEGQPTAERQAEIRARMQELAAAPRMKPRRGLFAVLLLAFLLWVGALLALYWQTVYPMRHPKAGATTARS